MNKEIFVQNLSNKKETLENVDIASFCPNCGVTLIPKTLYASLIEDIEDEYNNKVFLLNFCTHCKECFISRHLYDKDFEIYRFESSAPKHYFQANFSTNMQNLSPSFVSIFNEAAEAESLGLTSICGMGYRKSLEFLIKDYAISIHPEDEEKILSLPLAQCIDQYINGSQLKSLAKASTWLGNDETHYVKKHPNYGLPKLKAFISACTAYIDAELVYQEAQTLIST